MQPLFAVPTSIFAAPWFWGLLIALPLIPVLIHLINMLRHRRVKWAAMEFLLASYKKHKKWIILKQLLLLLSRMAILAALLAMIAQLGTEEPGGKVTHHYVVVDDSLSMSDREEGKSALDRAKEAIAQIAARAVKEKRVEQRFTLIRYSQALAAPPEGVTRQSAQALSDLNAELVFDPGEKDAEDPLGTATGFLQSLREKATSLETTQLAVGPEPALAVVQQLVNRSVNEKPIVYVLSDFRSRDWADPAAPPDGSLAPLMAEETPEQKAGRRAADSVAQFWNQNIAGPLAGRFQVAGGVSNSQEALTAVKDAGGDVFLIRCVGEPRGNLAITELAPDEGIRAAGAPIFMRVKVKNFSTAEVKNVRVDVSTITYDDDGGQPRIEAAGQSEVVEHHTQPVYFRSIGPGKEAEQRVEVFFPKAGPQVVKAQLPTDPLPDDNVRYAALRMPEFVKVLILDGGLRPGASGKSGGFYLKSILGPSSRVRTSIAAEEVESPAKLREMSAEQLRQHRVIYLIDVHEIDQFTARKLERYVREGGSVAIFMGPNVVTDAYNETLYRDGEGLLPAPLGPPKLLRRPLKTDEADFDVIDHPAVAWFKKIRNRSRVLIQQYISVKDWSPQDDPATQVIAKLRNGDPLMIERRLGRGRVIAFHSTLSPQWNGLVLDPSVVIFLSLQGYLEQEYEPLHVGQPLAMPFSEDRTVAQLKWLAPGEAAAAGTDPTAAKPVVIKEVKEKVLPRDLQIGATQPGQRRAKQTDRAGVYELWWAATPTGPARIERFALNVEAEEGNLNLVDKQRLAANLSDVEPTIQTVGEVKADVTVERQRDWSTIILLVIIGLLVVEQILSYITSYHPAAAASPR